MATMLVSFDIFVMGHDHREASKHGDPSVEKRRLDLKKQI